jgi:small subunit ribosomal protein S5
MHYIEPKKKLSSIQTVSLENFKNEIIEIRRVTKVGKGHKRFKFRVIVIIGDGLGSIGLGVGKHTEISVARLKGIKEASKNLKTFFFTEQSTICNVLTSRFRTCKIILKPASPGVGLIASKTIKIICELAGIKNISAKQLGSKNILNNAIATFKAFQTN